MKDSKIRLYTIEILIMIVFIIFMIPFFILLLNSLKDNNGILENPFSFDGFVGFDNYINLFKTNEVNIVAAIFTSIFVTACSLVLVIICASMAAWVLVRSKKRWSKIIFTMFVGSMVIPFQVVMFPLLETFASLGRITGISFLGNIYTLPIAYLAFQSALTIFMYHGFMKGIPLELEEAAMIDGCSKFQTYRLIILPILKPITVTVLILNGLWIWNDYLLPNMLLSGNGKTLPMALQFMASQSYGNNYEVLLPAAVLIMLPVVVLFLSAQKHIIKGMVEGSIK